MSKTPHPKTQALRALVARIPTNHPEAFKPPHVQLQGNVERLAAAAEALSNLHSIRNPTETDGAHTKKVSTAAARLKAEAEAMLSRMNTTVHTGMDAIQKSINAKVKLNPDAYAPEIRAAFRGKSQVEKFKLLGELVESNRGPELAAIVRAPDTLTGLTKEHKDRFAAAIVARHAPDEAEAEKALMASFDAALVAVGVAKDVSAVYSDPVALAEITAAENAAAAAAKSFQEATS